MFTIKLRAQRSQPKVDAYLKQVEHLVGQEISSSGQKLESRRCGVSASYRPTVQTDVLELGIHISNGRLDPAIDRNKLRDKITRVILQNPPESASVILEVIYLVGDADYFSSYWKFDGETVLHYHGGGSRHEVHEQGPGEFKCLDCDASCIS